MFTLVMLYKHFQRGGYGKWGANLSPPGSPGTSFFLFFFSNLYEIFYVFWNRPKKSASKFSHPRHSCFPLVTRWTRKRFLYWNSLQSIWGCVSLKNEEKTSKWTQSREKNGILKRRLNFDWIQNRKSQWTQLRQKCTIFWKKRYKPDTTTTIEKTTTQGSRTPSRSLHPVQLPWCRSRQYGEPNPRNLALWLLPGIYAHTISAKATQPREAPILKPKCIFLNR